ncbi:MAG: hypothetical protein J5778_07500 [Clostridiales bacterium]|nr:hypothetical protein [Clostridiales bacterium]
MALKSYQCSNCGANLNIDTFNLTAQCDYCGQKLTFDTEEIAEIFEEREKTKRMKAAEEEQTKRRIKEEEERTKREEAQLKHDAEVKKMQSDTDEFMEGARRVKDGFETVRSVTNTVKTIAICVVVGIVLIVALIALINILKHLG